jgi:hypothetical protein
LQLYEAERAEQVDQCLNIDRDWLEFEQAWAEKLDVREDNDSNLFPVK